MSAPDTTSARSTGPAGPGIDVEQAEAALVEHYPRLVRLAYLVLPPALGRNRRVLTAHALTQRALPRSGRVAADPAFPAPRRAGEGDEPGFAYVRLRVVTTALEAGRPLGETLRRRGRPRRAQLPPLLPQVWGLRLFPRAGGADELALDQRLAALTGPARAAYALRGLEGLDDDEVHRLLTAAGAEDPRQALDRADELPARYELLRSPEFDPCSLQARPTDLMRRRQHLRAAAVAGAALVVCGALLGMPGGGRGPDGAAAPAYSRNTAAEAALDPAGLTRVAPAAWKDSARTDFSVWPARGALTEDTALLRRALAVWARPGEQVQVSATPGTSAGPAPGPAQLLYAGEVDRARVVVLHDGLRVVRYAEPREGEGGVALDLARTDLADAASANALVVGRTDGNVRYLTAPWVRTVAVRDLLRPTGDPVGLDRADDGVTAPLAGPAQARDCTVWNVLELRDASGTRLMTDLGELTPARLTSGPPDAPRDVSGAAARRVWARTACLLPSLRSQGVRTVNNWRFAAQPLPERGGTANWLCTRADTWRGAGSLVMAQIQAPGRKTVPGSVAARAEDSPACGPRAPHVLAGVLWKSGAGRWYVLAAGSEQVTSIRTTGAAAGRADGNLLAVPTRKGARANLNGRLADGGSVSALH